MRTLFALLLLAAISMAVPCPFGFPPEDACPEVSPKCALYNDADGNGFCDNPIPPATEPPAGDSSATPPPDTLVTTPPDDTTGPGDAVEDQVTPEDPPDAPEVDQGDQPEDMDGTVDDLTAPDTASAQVENGSSDSLCVVISCPLGYTPAQACSSSAPSCALFTDADGDGRCDNPGPQSDSVAIGTATDSALTIPPSSLSRGCPRFLPPAAACPNDRQMCPHWFGRWSDDSCGNPERGARRSALILGFMIALLLVATIFSRKLRGGRRIRRKARTIRFTILGVGLLVLGFFVQGCFCPIGAFQYALIPGGLAFLGLVGWAVLLVPVLHTLFFGRIYCSWVCPMGALQEFLWRLHILRLPHPSRRLDHILLIGRAVIFATFVTLVVLAGAGALRVPWPALFCSIDPFHTVFSVFLTGSFLLGILVVALSVLWGRFFCRYLCFYGFVLGLACRAGLWTHLRRITRRRDSSCALPDESSPNCEIQQD